MTLSARHCSCGKHHLDHVSRGVGTRQIEDLRHRRRTWRGDSSLTCRYSCRHLSCERCGLNQSIPAELNALRDLAQYIRPCRYRVFEFNRTLKRISLLH